MAEPADSDKTEDLPPRARSLVDRTYEEAMARLGGTGRVQRTFSLYESFARMLRHQIAQRNPELSEREIRIKAAEHMYQSDPQTLELLKRVPRQ